MIFEGRHLFVFVKRRAGSPDPILDLGCLLLLECNRLCKICVAFFSGLNFHFDVVNLHFSSTARALAAENLRFLGCILSPTFFSAMFEVAHLF